MARINRWTDVADSDKPNALVRVIVPRSVDSNLVDEFTVPLSEILNSFVDEKFGGVAMNGPTITGQTTASFQISNLNQYIPDANVVPSPVFSDTNLLRNAPPGFVGVDRTAIGNYDRIFIRISAITGSGQSATRTQGVEFFVNVADWLGLTAVPRPDQGVVESATSRPTVVASTADNRALLFEFPQLPPAPFADELPTTSNPSPSDQRELEAAIQGWMSDFRASRRIIYIGRSNESNSRLLVGISGFESDFHLEARGYY